MTLPPKVSQEIISNTIEQEHYHHAFAHSQWKPIKRREINQDRIVLTTEENSLRQQIVENKTQQRTVGKRSRERTDIETVHSINDKSQQEKTPMNRDVNRQQHRYSNESHGTMHRK